MKVSGLAAGLSAALAPWRKPCAGHDPGVVLMWAPQKTEESYARASLRPVPNGGHLLVGRCINRRLQGNALRDGRRAIINCSQIACPDGFQV